MRRPLSVLFRRQLAENELVALIDNARAEVTRRTTRRLGGESLADEIVDRRLATHAAIASVLVDIRTAPDRLALLEPLRGALRRESVWLLSTGRGHVDVEGSERRFRDIDDAMSPDSIDCLMVAVGHDIDAARAVLHEALASILARTPSPTRSGSFGPLAQ